VTKLLIAVAGHKVEIETPVKIKQNNHLLKKFKMLSLFFDRNKLDHYLQKTFWIM